MDKYQQVLSLIAEYNQSDLGVKAFCAHKQISYHSFQYWRYKKNRQSKKRSAFTLIGTTAQPAQRNITINYPNGVSVNLESYDSNQIAQLIKLGNV